MSENPDWPQDTARKDPVEPHRCIWCKASPIQTPTQLTTGEHICQSCLGDLREFKRTRFVDLLVASSLEPSVKTTLLEEWQNARDVISSLHHGDPKLKALPTRTSNAHERCVHGDGEAGDDDN